MKPTLPHGLRGLRPWHRRPADNQTPASRTALLTDTHSVSPFASPILIAALLLIAYLMVTTILTVLAAYAKHHLDRHNLLRKTRTLRLEYEREVMLRQRQVTSVEIIEDGPGLETLQMTQPEEQRLAA
jgi:hypothetical protein